MSQVNKLLVTRHVKEILNFVNLDACKEIIAENFIEHALAPFGTSEPGKVNGPAAMRESMEWLHAQFPDLTMKIEEIIAEGDIVAVRIISEGTNLGRLNGKGPITGKKFTSRQSHWYRIKNNKICEHWATRDDLTAMLQLGVIKRPGPPAPILFIKKLLKK